MLSRQTLDTIISIAKMEIDPVTNKDYEELARDILDTTGESLGVNTLKRMFGRVNDDTRPTQKSLNIVARYMGHVDWKNYEASLMDSAEQIFDIDEPSRGYHQYICVDGLRHGAVVDFRYEPNARVRLLYIGDYLFRVLFSTGKALAAGELLKIYSFEDGGVLTVRKMPEGGDGLPKGIRIGCIHGGISYLNVE